MSYKGRVKINEAKRDPTHFEKREKWIRLYLKFSQKYKSENVLSVDETAWYYNMGASKEYSIIGQDNTESSTTKGRRLTLIAAISIHGVESLTIVEGGCKAP